MGQTTGNEMRKAAAVEQDRPPLPKGMYKLLNPLMKAVLRSPFHKGMSRQLMVLTFTGRKTGKRFSTPVGYVRQGEKVFVFTHSGWRSNFQQPAPVSMRIQGQEVPGSARLVTNLERVKQIIQVLTAAYGEKMSRRMGLWVENLETASPEAVRQATRRTHFIEIQVADGK